MHAHNTTYVLYSK